MEVFGNQRLPEAAEVVRARLAALFRPAFAAEESAAGPQGEPSESPEGAAAEHLHAEPRRWRLTGRHVVVVAVVALVAVVGSLAWLLRAKAVPIAVAVPTVSSPLATVGASATAVQSASHASSASATPTAKILVHVLGAVASPGVVTLAEGARVSDALAAAGGLRGDADPAELNLAAVLADGDQVVIGTKASPRGEVRTGGGSTTVTSSGATTTTGALVDLNTATEAQLEALPGVGPVTAAAILAYRTQHGRFTKTEELQEVDGIGAKTYAQIAPHVRV